MKKSFILFLAFCGVMALLVAPGMAVADTFVFPSNPDGVGAYRDLGNLNGYSAALAIVSLTNAVWKQDPPGDMSYTPGPGQPGYIPILGTNQHQYIFNLSSPTGGQLPNIPYLDPIYQAVSGLVVLSNAQLTLPPSGGFLDSTFLSQVEGIIAFVPGCSTAVIYENFHQVPEPGALLLLGFGLIALTGMRRGIKK